MPLPASAVGGRAVELITDRDNHRLVAGGTATTCSGNEIGMVWTTEDLTDWEVVALRPLLGSENSAVTGLAGGGGGGGAGGDGGDGGTVCYGSSYPPDGDATTDGVATIWPANFVGDEVYFGPPTDLNELVVDLPEGAMLTHVLKVLPVDDVDVYSACPGTMVVSICWPSPPSSRDTPLPHAAVLIAQPQNIPAVSEWGLVAMALLGLTVGTLMFRRRLPAQAE